MRGAASAAVLALLLATAAVAAAAAPPSPALIEALNSCPLDMDKVLPTATWDGPLPCVRCENLKGKIALITGASTGIGKATAERMAKAGMTVIGTSRYPWQYPKPAGYQLWQMDQTKPAQVTALIQRMRQTYRRIDFLFLNAGRGGIHYGMFQQNNMLAPFNITVPPQCMDATLAAQRLNVETNYWGTLRVLRAAAPLLPKRGYARVLIHSSIESLNVPTGFLGYAVAKAGTDRIADEWYNEHKPLNMTNVQVSILNSGHVRTEIYNKSIIPCPEMAPLRPIFGSVAFQVFPTMEAEQAGEAVYRIALTPRSSRRYFLNEPYTGPYMKATICMRLTKPAEIWQGEGWGPPTLGAFFKPPQAG